MYRTHAPLAEVPGWVWRDVVFFLSGYLITTMMRLEYANTGKLSLRNFYIRRILRINPPLYITLAFIGYLVIVGVLNQSPTALGVLSQFFFFSNYMPDHGTETGLPSPLWSLAVEEHFYLIFPLCFVMAMKCMSTARFAALCAVACAVVLAVRLFNIIILGLGEENYYWTHTRFDSILFGCILALWANPALEVQPSWQAKGWQAMLAVLVIIGTFAMSSILLREGIRYSLQGAALLVIFNYQLQNRNIASKYLRWSVLQRIGLWSYTLYLVHYALLYSMQSIAPDFPPILSAMIALAISCAYCAIMYALVEKPLTDVRRRLTPAR
ncbi:MAG: hypothetical protein B7Y89_01410 [Novosphingobium sp. 32-60-15]|nr:MAG: hypothetical protein B7Y89_01410 [Novosphingobium sp. 32-60-15]